MLKLYRVTLRGMTIDSIGIAYGVSYVIATDTDKAYKKVKDYLDKKNIGYKSDRELDKIELIADSYAHNDVGYLLYT